MAVDQGPKRFLISLLDAMDQFTIVGFIGACHVTPSLPGRGPQ